MVLLMTSLLLCGNASASASFGRPGTTGQQAPLFSLETVKGATVSLDSHQGKGVILFFFTTWCPYCVRKLPDLAERYEQFTKDNIALLVIDSGESQRKVSAFVERQVLPFDVLLDQNMAVAQSYEVIGVPTFVLISPAGQIVFQGNELPDDYRRLIS